MLKQNLSVALQITWFCFLGPIPNNLKLQFHKILIDSCRFSNFECYIWKDLYLILFQAAVSPNHNLSFQSEFVRLRCETLQAHVQLLNACSLVRSCPPPAISSMTSNAESTSSDTRNAKDNTILTNQAGLIQNYNFHCV